MDMVAARRATRVSSSTAVLPLLALALFEELIPAPLKSVGHPTLRIGVIVAVLIAVARVIDGPENGVDQANALGFALRHWRVPLFVRCEPGFFEPGGGL
jgi:uncharacterized membrane protein